jgi:hypothetical protein
MPRTRKPARTIPPAHESQETYYLARAAYDCVAAEVERQIVARGYTVTADMEDEEQVLALYERQEDVKDELGLYNARKILRLAEEVMVDYMLDHAAAFSPEHAAEVRAAAERAKTSVIHWPKFVDLAARLRAEHKAA